jgi:hypothetical protein
MREILEELTQYDQPSCIMVPTDHQHSILESICVFIQEQLSRNKAIRIIYSRADGVKISEHREHLNYIMQKFEVCHPSS